MGEGVVTLIDVATGGADIPIAARRWALGAGFDLRITGVDLHETTLDLAKRAVEEASRADARIGEGITLRRADAKKLVDEFGANSFDYAHASLFLHHLPDIEVLTVLRVMDRLARRGIVWNDLVRSRLHRLAARVGTIGAPAIVKHDAVVSVEAGFTKKEALDIAQRVGIESARWECPLGWYRFTVAAEKKM
jgi:ubiquinone/menaquinone biosynthesis C-methylase UbiE